jgi:hypothetical protein
VLPVLWRNVSTAGLHSAQRTFKESRYTRTSEAVERHCGERKNKERERERESELARDLRLMCRE